MQSREYSFKGHSYKIAYMERYAGDASWFTHEDESIVRDRDWNIQPGDNIVDIGSAFGSYTLAGLAVGATRAVCFNPNAEENGFLEHSLEMNGWRDKVQIFGTGLFSKSGWLRDTDQTFSETKQDGFFDVRSLDSFKIGPFEGRTWLKIDVEGGEVHVLNGAVEFITVNRPVILVENHQFIDATLQQKVENFLNGMDYRLIHCIPHHGVSHSLFEP